MPKLSIKFVLPLCQVSLATFLLACGHRVTGPLRLDTPYVPTVTLVCMGINAPCLLVRPLLFLLTGLLPDHGTLDVIGFGLDEILFLATVAALWYLVARRLVAFRSRNENQLGEATKDSLVWHLMIAAVGTILFILGIALLRSPGRWNNPVGNKVEGILTILWALALLISALRNLFEARQSSRLAPGRSQR
jgi:hypothetical protein